MVRAQKCECGGFYVFSHFGGSFPGGKEREEEFCPHCNKLVFSEMTSGCTSIRAATADEILRWKQEQSQIKKRQTRNADPDIDDLI